MKLSDLKPCACCGGPLVVERMEQWYEFRVSMVMLNPRAAQQVIGTMAIFGAATSQALGIAEAMAPRADDAVMVLGEKDKELYTTAQICYNCFAKPLNQLVQAASERDKHVSRNS